jgi:hypothetical protein
MISYNLVCRWISEPLPKGGKDRNLIEADSMAHSMSGLAMLGHPQKLIVGFPTEELRPCNCVTNTLVMPTIGCGFQLKNIGQLCVALHRMSTGRK